METAMLEHRESRPADKTQPVDLDALQMAQAPESGNPEGPQDPRQDALPPMSEEPTQPIPLVPMLEPMMEAEPSGPDATVRIQPGSPPEPETRVIAPAVLEPQKMAPRELPAQGRKRMPLWGWASLVLLVLLLGLGGVYVLKPEFLGLQGSEAAEPADAAASPEPGVAPDAKAEAAPSAEIPPALRSYFEKAQKGDAAAMRMLGVMYYNGLNVPKNAQEGLKWYRRAADAGSTAAQKELKALEGKAASK